MIQTETPRKGFLNSNPEDMHSMWRVDYDDATGEAQLTLRDETGEYFTLLFTDEEITEAANALYLAANALSSLRGPTIETHFSEYIRVGTTSE